MRIGDRRVLDLITCFSDGIVFMGIENRNPQSDHCEGGGGGESEAAGEEAASVKSL